MNLLHYLAEANIYLGIFYLCYWLLLKNETHYTLNRIYLLVSCVLAFIIPFIRIGALLPAESSAQRIMLIPSGVPVVHHVTQSIITESGRLSPQDYLLCIYLTGVGLLSVLLMVKLYNLLKLTRTKTATVENEFKLIELDGSNSAFSFFNYLFIGKHVPDAATVMRHEMVHIRQRHSADIIFVELIRISSWFNPFIYLLRNSLKAVHEYIADERTVTNGNDTLGYATFLLNNAYGLGGPSITHSFFNYNLLKKRIIMLNQKRSGNLARLKYLVYVPVCAGMLCLSTLAFSKNYGWINIIPKHVENQLITKSGQHNGHSRLLIKHDGIVTLTDQFSEKIGGSTKLYTVYNLTANDKAALAKKGFLVSILDDVKIDTIKNKIPPPPPPARPHAKVVFPAPKNPSQVTKNGYKYAESGYLINGKTDFRVIIVEKDGNQKSYFKSSASAAEVKLLKDKYGYTFPAMDIFSKLPPPPPAPPAKMQKVMPTPPASALAPVKAEAPLPPVKNQKLPPPPPPAPPRKAYNKTKSSFERLAPEPEKHFISNIMMGEAQTLGKPVYDKEDLIYPQMVYIHLDKVTMENVKPNEPIIFGDNAVYLINGKIYTNTDLQKHSASISTKNNIGTLFSAEKTIYHKPDNPDNINKYGSIAKDGITEFVNVRDSKL